MKVQLDLLGGFAAHDSAGRRLTFPTLKSEALLAYLALQQGRTVYREKLCTLLWGSFAEAQARSSLRQALLRIRRTWPATMPCCLVSSGREVRVEANGLSVDVTAFESFAAAGTPEALQAAADLYRGDLLEGLAIDEPDFEDWLMVERSRLQALAHGVLQGLLQHYASTGAIERGIRVANRLLALDPFQESVQRTLMRFYLYQERRGAALAQFHRCRQVLQEELGVEPEPATQALFRQILAAEPDSLCEHGLDTGLGEEAPPASHPERPAHRPTTLSSPRDAHVTIAVMPFEDRCDEPGQGYLSSGIAEDIITALTRFREIAVIARNSSFSYRHDQASPRQIGQALGVHYLLLGSLRRQGNRSRLTASLIEATSARQVWAQAYDASLDEIFAVQDDLVRQIVVALVGQIAADRLSQARRKPPANWSAYDHWLQGMAHLRRVDEESLAEARAAFQRAARADPGFARAHAGIAMTCYHAWSCFNWNAWANLQSQAADHARKALALDELDHHAHCILSTSYVFDRQFGRAESHLNRALAYNPNDANTLANAALVWSFLGEAGKAVETAETALRLDPHRPDWYSALLGLAYFVKRDYPAAIKAMEQEPQAMCDTRAYLAAAHALAGNDKDAKHHSREFLRFCASHLGGDPASEIHRYMTWLVDSNAYRRVEDRDHFLLGLRSAGLPV